LNYVLCLRLLIERIFFFFFFLEIKIDNDKDATGFLIDGFPRNIEQAEIFEKGIAMAKAIINLEGTFCFVKKNKRTIVAQRCGVTIADEEAMTKRILARAATSGRSDDNVDALRKRFATHREQCEPVIAYYAKVGRVKTIDANGTVAEVYAQAITQLALNDE
jgi:UMP-CMP kinase